MLCLPTQIRGIQNKIAILDGRLHKDKIIIMICDNNNYRLTHLRNLEFIFRLRGTRESKRNKLNIIAGDKKKLYSQFKLVKYVANLDKCKKRQRSRLSLLDYSVQIST